MATTQCYVGGLELNSRLHFIHAVVLQTVNRASQNAKTLKICSGVNRARRRGGPNHLSQFRTIQTRSGCIIRCGFVSVPIRIGEHDLCRNGNMLARF